MQWRTLSPPAAELDDVLEIALLISFSVIVGNSTESRYSVNWILLKFAIGAGGKKELDRHVALS